MHAFDPCNITASGNNTAPAAANNYWLVLERGVITFLDAGVEGIAFDMGDG